MGHMLNNTIQDVLIRRARMLGFNACWVPGTDHASIATEAKVVALLKEQGIKKADLSREDFLKHAWDWKEKYGGIILEQLKKLGASCDWDRTRFTMDEPMSEAVIDVFIDLYNKGHIYRGVKMINWDPKAKTALSDEEVNHKEVNSKLVYVKYFLSKQNDSTQDSIIIATVRPETILGDTAICVHPDDERYKQLVGKTCFVPLINREIPIIADEYIDMEFGTGCLKVTPAHDINDYNLGIKHGLPVIDTLNEDGTMSEAAGLYIGEDRFDVRKKIIDDLQAAGHIEKVEDLDIVSSPLLTSENGNNMRWKSSTQFYFKKNFIIKYYDGYDNNNHWDNKHFIYEIKNINDTTFWGSKINRYEIVSLYAKENVLYALIKKSYSDLKKETYGVYKLHFVDEEKITNKLAEELNKKQIEEDYKSAMKLQGYGGALREKIKIKYKTLK
jgi:valyl-tRNA synthetase